MKRYLQIIILLFVQYSFGQTAWKAELPFLEKSDYYHVELDQELIGAGLNYLKILDENDNETPYFIRSSNPVQEISSFENFDLVKNNTKDSLNIIIVNNETAENLNRFCIVFQQAETQKFVSIRGSNDLKQWYIVKRQTKEFEYSGKTGDNTEMLIVDFPKGNYRYYEITLGNDQKSPLEVLKIGKINNSNIYGNYTEVFSGKPVMGNNSEDKNTRLSFPELKNTYCINKIEFSIKNKPDYYRQAIVIDSTSYDRKRFYLSSGNENTILMNDFLFTPRTFVFIENQNNPPLVINSIKIFGLCRYACAYLEAGKKYRIVLNNQEPIVTTYDIEYFRDKIPTDIEVLKTKNLSDYVVPETVTPKRELTLFERPLFLWSVITVMGIFLVFICLRMIKEIKKTG
jgi:hypothetical protein